MAEIRSREELCHRHFLGADFARSAARFVFERADGEIGAVVTVAKILLDPRLEAAASFTLRDVDEIMQKQFAVAPGIGTNDDGVAEADAPYIVGDNAGASRRLGQLRIVGQGNAINHQHSHAGTILNASPARILSLPWG